MTYNGDGLSVNLTGPRRDMAPYLFCRRRVDQ